MSEPRSPIEEAHAIDKRLRKLNKKHDEALQKLTDKYRAEQQEILGSVSEEAKEVLRAGGVIQ